MVESSNAVILIAVGFAAVIIPFFFLGSGGNLDFFLETTPGGFPIIFNGSGNEFFLNSLIPGDNIIITNTTNGLLINATLTVNGTGGGNQTHISLGGETDIFKNETGSIVNFRGLSGGDQIDLTQRTNDILIDLEPCNDGELLIYNSTTSEFECLLGQVFSSGSSIDNDEIFFPHLSATNADDVKITFTNYDLRAVRFNDNVNVAATWKYVVPTNFNSTGTTLQFKLFWFSQSSDTGNVCWQFRINDIIENDDLDFSFIQVDEICTPNLGIDILAVDTFLIPASTHNFEAQELAFIQIHREAKQDDNPNDTFEQNAYAVIGELRWIE